MKKLSLLISAAVTAMTLVSSSAFALQTSAPKFSTDKGGSVTGAAPSVYAERVAYLCNQERKKAGLPELLYSPVVSKASQVRADEISVNYNSAHLRPNGSICFTALDELNITYSAVGENIARGQNTPESAIKSWMESKIHRDNILNTNFTTIGVGVTDANGYISWSQFFVNSSTADSSAYLPRNFGDVNSDGAVDAVDASLVLTEYAVTSVNQPSILTDNQKTLGNMNGDSVIDATDASLVLSMYAINSVIE